MPPPSIPINWTPAPLPGPVTLRGRYVTLEPLDPVCHTPALWNAVRGHDGVWTWLADGPYESEAAFFAGLERKQLAKDAVFLAILPNSNGLAANPHTRLRPPGDLAGGYASYMRMDPAHGVIEVGNILLAPHLQRSAAATEAMYLMACHVFEHLGYRRYEWKCNARNEPSRQAALRLGFKFEGIFRQHMVIKGRSRDTAWFSMLDVEWPARKLAFEKWLDPGNFDSLGLQKHRLAARAT